MTNSTVQLPPEICAEDEQSFAAYTLRQRLPHIVEQIIHDNSYSPDVVAELNILIAEISSGTIQSLKQSGYVDSNLWHDCLQTHVGKSWFTAPFFFVEMYFYRRLGEIIGYLDLADKQENDPFRWQKRESLEQDLAAATSLATWMEATHADAIDSDAHALCQVLLANLWSNCADLSQIPKTEAQTQVQDNLDKLLLDDSDVIASLIPHQTKPLNRIDIVLDNTGIELISDLALADFLIKTNLAKQVILHAKAQPVFVSDVMKHDVLLTLEAFITSDVDVLRKWGKQLKFLLEIGAIAIQDHYFWTLPLDFRSMTADLWADLQNTDLLISKGDANYRRLVGDRHWHIHTPITQVVDYFPFPCVALRVLKSEILVGMDGDRLKQFNLEQDWMINGTYGIIQFVPASTN
ncbi:MAG: protein-glutamate O-methyltransferase family protein [Cyanothece sp. SIO2G6]|nr:protein-glutamate O-methyltransferase family protein [Cyanothece sp. SIO2G6]